MIQSGTGKHTTFAGDWFLNDLGSVPHVILYHSGQIQLRHLSSGCNVIQLMFMIMTLDHSKDQFHRICLIEKGKTILRDNGDPIALHRLQTHLGRETSHLASSVRNAIEMIQTQGDHIQLAAIMITLAQILSLGKRQPSQTARVHRLPLPDRSFVVQIKHFF